MANRIGGVLGGALLFVLLAAHAASGSHRKLAADGCQTVWEAISTQNDYTYLTDALLSTGLAEVLDQQQLDLTLLAPSDTVWDETLPKYGLDTADLIANMTDNQDLWAFHIVRRTIFYSTILNNLGPYNAVTFPTLFPFNRMTFIYRNSSENIYVVGYQGKSVLRTFKDNQGNNPNLCSGRLYRTDVILLPNLDYTSDSDSLPDLAEMNF